MDAFVTRTNTTKQAPDASFEASDTLLAQAQVLSQVSVHAALERRNESVDDQPVTDQSVTPTPGEGVLGKLGTQGLAPATVACTSVSD